MSENFEKNVKYHFDFIGDQLIIGKFCMIASDVKFIMNGANHLTDSVSTYPFASSYYTKKGVWFKKKQLKRLNSMAPLITAN